MTPYQSCRVSKGALAPCPTPFRDSDAPWWAGIRVRFLKLWRTLLALKDGDQFVAVRSPDSSEHDPDYEELGRFPTRAKAEEFLAELE